MESLVWNAMLNTSMFTAGCAQMGASMKAAQSSAGGLSGALATVAKVSFVGLIAGIGAVTAAIGKATSAAGQWEKDMARIAKVTDLEKGTQAYTQMSRDLLDIMAKMPATQQDIMDVAATLGQLGIEQTGIPALTESILKMTSALEISGEAGATWIAKMANLNKGAVEQAGGIDQFATKMGSAVNALENVSVAKATDITGAMTEAAGSFKAWNMNVAQQAAMITTAISRGVDPGLMRTMLASAVGGEGLYGTGRSFTNQLTGEVMKSVSGLDIAGKFLGVDAKEVDRRFTENSYKLITDVVDAVQKTGLSPGQQQATLQKIFGGYASKEIAKLGGSYEEYTGYLAIANEEMQTGQSINKEYEKSIDNLIDKGTIFKNSLKALAIEVGELFTPMASGALGNWSESIQNAIQWIRQMKDEGKGIKDIFKEAFSVISQNVINKLKSINWTGVISGLLTGVSTLVLGLVGPTIKKLQKIISSVDWQGAFDTVQDAFEDATDNLMDAAEDAWDSIKQTAEDIDWQGAFNTIKDTAKTAFETARDAILSVDWVGAGTELSDKIKNGAIQVVSTFQELGDKIKDTIDDYDWSNVGKSVAELIKQAIVLAFEITWDIGQIIWSAISGSLESSADKSWFSVIGETYWEFLSGFKQEMLGDTTWQDVIFHPIRTAVNMVSNFFSEQFPYLENDIRGLASEMLITIMTWQPEWTNVFIRAFNTVREHVVNFVNDVIARFGALFDTISYIAHAIYETIAGMWPGTDTVPDYSGALATSTAIDYTGGTGQTKYGIEPYEGRQNYIVSGEGEKELSYQGLIYLLEKGKSVTPATMSSGSSGTILGTGDFNPADWKSMIDQGNRGTVSVQGIGSWLEDKLGPFGETNLNPQTPDVSFTEVSPSAGYMADKATEILESATDVLTMANTLASPGSVLGTNILIEATETGKLDTDTVVDATKKTGSDFVGAADRTSEKVGDASDAITGKASDILDSVEKIWPVVGDVSELNENFYQQRKENPTLTWEPISEIVPGDLSSYQRTADLITGYDRNLIRPLELIADKSEKQSYRVVDSTERATTRILDFTEMTASESKRLHQLFTGELENLVEGFNDVSTGAATATSAIDLLNGAYLTAEASCTECQEAMSEFGLWQEKNADRMFNRSFIGPTDDYQKFLESETARGAIHPEPVQLSMVYNAETKNAESAIETVQISAKTPQAMPLSIEDAEFTGQMDILVTTATTEQKMPLGMDASSALATISAVNAAASAPVIKPVYVVTYGDYGNGGITGYLEELSPGITSSPNWGTSSWLPQLASGMDYVPYDGYIAALHQGERVLTASENRQYGNAPAITINSTVVVEGGTTVDEETLYRVLQQRDSELKSDIINAYSKKGY